MAIDPGEHAADVVLRFLNFLATEENIDGTPASTLLVYFSSVLGISNDNMTFEQPSNYTPELSGLIHCGRLIFLESLLPQFSFVLNDSSAFREGLQGRCGL